MGKKLVDNTNYSLSDLVKRGSINPSIAFGVDGSVSQIGNIVHVEMSIDGALNGSVNIGTISGVDYPANGSIAPILIGERLTSLTGLGTCLITSEGEIIITVPEGVAAAYVNMNYSA